MSTERSVLCIERINYLNFALVLLLKTRYDVLAWQIDLPTFLGNLFGRLKGYEILTRDEWLIAQDKCFDVWKASVLPHVASKLHCSAVIRGRSVDFSVCAWQRVADQFENTWMFMAAVRKFASNNAFATYALPVGSARHLYMEQLCAEYVDLPKKKTSILDWLDSIEHRSLSAALFIRNMSYLLASLKEGVGRYKHKKILWAGISPTEVPSGAGKITFAWAVQYGVLNKEDVMYFLPNEPGQAQKHYLQNSGVCFVGETKGIYSLLTRRSRLKLFCYTATTFLCALFRRGVGYGFLARFIPRAILWDAVLEVLEATCYITSQSASWPERPEIAIVKARGLRSIIWAYSASSLTYAHENRNFRDVAVMRSILNSDEVWVWNQSNKDWLQRRTVADPDAAPEIHVIGPVMCGDVSYLHIRKEDALSILGISGNMFTICVFDIPLISEVWRRKYGGAPWMIHEDTYEVFFRDIFGLLDSFPDIRILTKLRWGMDDASRVFPSPELEKARQYGKCGRIVVLDSDVDPYLPFAACDLALGMTFTSPVLVALSFGRPAAYYDPLSRAGGMPEKDFASVTLRSKAELVEFISSALEGRSTINELRIPGILPPKPQLDFFRNLAG